MTTATPHPDVTVVVPILNERGTLVELTERVIAECGRAGHSVELLLIDDGSSDGSWETISRLAQEHDEVQGIRQRRTFGKAAALNVGFERAAGDVIVTMDGDLQDDPSELPHFFAALAADGTDAVSGWKKERHDPLGKRIPSKFFNLVLRNVSGLRLHDFNCGFKAYSRDAVEALRPFVYGDMHRYLPAVLGAQGFSVDEIEVRHHARVYGESKYGVGRIFAGSFDLMTIMMLTKYRYRPMHAFGAASAIAFVATVVLATLLGAFGQGLFAGVAIGTGLLLVMTLLGVGVVSELAVHGMGAGGTDRRISAIADHEPELAPKRVRTQPDPTTATVDAALGELASSRSIATPPLPVVAAAARPVATPPQPVAAAPLPAAPAPQTVTAARHAA